MKRRLLLSIVAGILSLACLVNVFAHERINAVGKEFVASGLDDPTGMTPNTMEEAIRITQEAQERARTSGGGGEPGNGSGKNWEDMTPAEQEAARYAALDAVYSRQLRDSSVYPAGGLKGTPDGDSKPNTVEKKDPYDDPRTKGNTEPTGQEREIEDKKGGGQFIGTDYHTGHDDAEPPYDGPHAHDFILHTDLVTGKTNLKRTHRAELTEEEQAIIDKMKQNGETELPSKEVQEAIEKYKQQKDAATRDALTEEVQELLRRKTCGGIVPPVDSKLLLGLLLYLNRDRISWELKHEIHKGTKVPPLPGFSPPPILPPIPPYIVPILILIFF